MDLRMIFNTTTFESALSQRTQYPQRYSSQTWYKHHSLYRWNLPTYSLPHDRWVPPSVMKDLACVLWTRSKQSTLVQCARWRKESIHGWRFEILEGDHVIHWDYILHYRWLIFNQKSFLWSIFEECASTLFGTYTKTSWNVYNTET